MAWLASLPGRLLERVGNGAPRGMTVTPFARVVHRTRLIGRLPFFHIRSKWTWLPLGVSRGSFALRRKNIFVDNFVGFLKASL